MKAKLPSPDQTTHDPDSVAFNQDLFNWYQKFLGLRNQYRAIRKGSFEPVIINDAEQVYAFSRKLDDEEVVVLINRGNKAVQIQEWETEKRKV
jgi:cyclomaltodextrinase